MSKPVICRWNGESFIPIPQMHNLVNAEYVVGEVYRLAEIEDRSNKTHNHFFVCVNEAWMNLPEETTANHPSAEHLRKWCLINCGYADERSIVCSTKAEAQRVAAFIKPIDDFAVVIVRECVVKVFTAQSQSKKAMGAKVFQESKEKVLDLLQAMVGADIRKHAGEAV